MLVSVLTYTLGYRIANHVVICMVLTALVVEFWWIQIVYERFPILRIDDERRLAARKTRQIGGDDLEAEQLDRDLGKHVTSPPRRLGQMRKELESWREFMAMPVIWSAPFGDSTLGSADSQLPWRLRSDGSTRSRWVSFYSNGCR